MIDATQRLESEVGEMYSQLQKKVTLCQKPRWKMDACMAVTAELMKIRLTEDEEEFDAVAERQTTCAARL